MTDTARPLHTAATWDDKVTAARRSENIALAAADAINTARTDPLDPWAYDLRRRRFRVAMDEAGVWRDYGLQCAEARDSAFEAERSARRARYGLVEDGAA